MRSIRMNRIIRMNNEQIIKNNGGVRATRAHLNKALLSFIGNLL